ncbi:MAG: aquaporin Z [Victivallaceae bacterium]|nr:aquaporin Z [Victivallaceae bacterium]
MNFFSKKTAAELIGTFWLVFGGCSAAVFAGSQIGYAGIALAFGLTVFTGAYAFGHISGGHFNPAVSLGLWAAGRFEKKELLPYFAAQIVGGVLACFAMWAIQAGQSTLLEHAPSFAANGFGEFSPSGYNFAACALVEVLLTFVFLIVICGATDKRAPNGFAPAAIGLCLTLIHLIGIPITNLSVNPARSFGPAFVQMFAGSASAMQQVWFFFLMPCIGAWVAGFLYKKIFESEK